MERNGEKGEQRGTGRYMIELHGAARQCVYVVPASHETGTSMTECSDNMTEGHQVAYTDLPGLHFKQQCNRRFLRLMPFCFEKGLSG